MLCLIGEAFDNNSDEVCGATVNIRGKIDKVSLWTGDAAKKDATLAIGWVVLHIQRKAEINYNQLKLAALIYKRNNL